MTEFHMYEYPPFCPLRRSYSTGFGFPIVRLSLKPHPLQMRLVRLIGKLLEEDSEEFFHRVRSHLASFNM